MDNKELLSKAIDFHGHTGVFLAVGLKMGLLAKGELGGDCFSLKALVKTATHPPRSCLIDGIQVSTGCTLGKMNIKVEESSELSGVFTNGEKSLEIIVKEDFLQALQEKMVGRDRHHLDDLTEETMAMNQNQIFFFKFL